jgi:hypothetical protein
MGVDYGVAFCYDAYMAEWGKINAGQTFHVLAVDLDRALAHLQLNRYESMVLQYVREHSWGIAVKAKRRGEPWPDAVPCVINASELSRVWGVPRQRLNDAKWNLVNRRILIEENCSVTISKVVEMWVGLSPAGLAYARSAQPEKPACTERPSVHVINDAPISDHAKHERGNVQGVNAPAFSACTSHTIEGPRTSEIKKTSEDQTGAGWRETPSQPIPSKPADPALPDIEDADIDRRAAALRQITDAAREAFGWRGEEWATRYGHEYTERVPAVLAAIRDGRVMERSGKPIESVGGFVRMKLRSGQGRGGVAVAEPPKPKYTPEQIREMEARRAASIRPAKGYDLKRKVD